MSTTPMIAQRTTARPARRVEVLHIDDDPCQRALVSWLLERVEGLELVPRPAAGEDEAVAAFEQGGVGLVILDYYLDQGAAPNCLRRLRAIDPGVPVLVVSGSHEPTVSAQMMALGADEYLGKECLNGLVFPRIVREVLARRRRAAARAVRAPSTAPRPGTA
jgi:two-component system C4-dicarboxylate transport response regulator DctD